MEGRLQSKRKENHGLIGSRKQKLGSMSESSPLVLNDEVVVFRNIWIANGDLRSTREASAGSPCNFMQELSGVGENLMHCSCFSVAGVWCEKGTPKHLAYLLVGCGGIQRWLVEQHRIGVAQREQRSPRTPVMGSACCPHRPDGTIHANSHQELCSEGSHHRLLRPPRNISHNQGVILAFWFLKLTLFWSFTERKKIENYK